MRAPTIKTLVWAVLVVVALHFAYDLWRDTPDVVWRNTGAGHSTVRNPFV
jgi:regulatory protein YycH of two-component signal transduction system YycFG